MSWFVTNQDILDAIAGSERRIKNLIGLLIKKEDQQMAVLDDLEAKVDAEGTVVGSAITLLQGLKAALDAAIASGDLSKVQEISDKVGAQTQSLADAVAANTPSA